VRRHGSEGGKEEDREDLGDPWHLAPRGGHGLRCARAISELKSGQGLRMPLHLYLSRMNLARMILTCKFLGDDGSATVLYI